MADHYHHSGNATHVYRAGDRAHPTSDDGGGAEADSINQAAFIYTARNGAVGIALIVAFVLKNKHMLFALILVRLLTDIVDLPTLLYFDLVSNQVLVISVFVFLYYISAVIALRFLWDSSRKAAP